MTISVSIRWGHLDRIERCIHGRIEGFCSVCPEMQRQFDEVMADAISALAAGSRRAKTAKPVEGEASQSGGCKPQRPTSTTPISIPQEPEHG